MAKSNRVIEQEPKPRIIDERFEMRLAAIVRGAEQRGSTFSDADVNEIRDILLKAGKKTWSARPRTYAVLLMAGALDLMDEFVKLELSDYNFPYKIGRIPLCVKGPTLRQSFFNKQTVVLTDIKGAERGQHSYLATNADPHFEILDRLGKGGQALVEKVRSKLSLRDYARKSFVRGRKFEGSESETSFKNELQNLKRLSHLHLVQYIGSYTDPQIFALLLLPIADCDLKAYLSRDKFPEVDLTYLRDFFGCITSAITYLHRNKCRHKDITSRNVLIKHNIAYVTDFGLALDWTELSKSKTDGPVGAVSKHYVAPEVWDEKGVRGSASDMWALGCVFFDIVTVLKGRTLLEKKEFLEKNGSGGANPRENFEGYESWMKELGQINPRQDALPLSWTKKLVLQDPDLRSDAEELLNEILTCSDREDGYTYHCLLCDGDNGGDVPPMRALRATDTGSEDEDESSSKVDMYTFESIDHGLCNAVRRGDKRDSWTWLKRWTARPGFQDEMVKSQALHLAANAGLTSIVTDLLKNGFSVNATFNQSFPLHTAIGRAYTDTAKLLLEQGADPNARDSQHRTPLHFACTLGLEPVVQLLLDKGADVNATDVLLSTPLHQSVNSRRSAIVAKLLKQPGINVSVYVRELQASLTTPFFAAVLGGGVGIVQAFIDFGVNIQAEESFTHYTPLHAAASAEKLDVANLLIEKGADVNAPIGNEWGAPPVFIAIQRGDANMVRLLVESGAKTDAVDRGGFTAVHAMINFSHSELLPVLLQYGFDINMQNKAGQTPIVFALQLKKFESAQILLNEKASLHIGPASERRSLLHYAAVMNNLDILRFLHVQRDAIPVDTLDRENMTPLMRAAGFGHLEAATMLIQHGAGIEKRGLENRTALFIAVEYRRKEVVELLLSKGADVNVRAVNGMTPLHVAVIVENVEIARLLLDAGADTAAKDRQKKTALQWAKQRRSEEIVKLLGGTEMTSRFSFFRRRLRLPSR